MSLPPQLPPVEIKPLVVEETKQSPFEKTITLVAGACFEVDNEPFFCALPDDWMRKTGRATETNTTTSYFVSASGTSTTTVSTTGIASIASPSPSSGIIDL